ncbi:zinc-finger domain-containing protein [Bacillus cereus]|nr:zinc-finger domain-containing protein [Bacillus cereus]
MRVVARRMRICHLQQQFCEKCKYYSDSSLYCTEHCGIGKELNELKKRTSHRRRIREKNREEIWEETCQKAVYLYEKGMEYPCIAKKLKSHVSNLYRELQKRGLYKPH